MVKKKVESERWKEIYFSTHAFLKTFCQRDESPTTVGIGNIYIHTHIVLPNKCLKFTTLRSAILIIQNKENLWVIKLPLLLPCPKNIFLKKILPKNVRKNQFLIYYFVLKSLDGQWLQMPSKVCFQRGSVKLLERYTMINYLSDTFSSRPVPT